MLQHVVLEEVLEDSCIVLVSPNQQLGQLTKRFDQGGLVECIDNLIGRIQEHVVDSLKLLERMGGHLVIGRSPKDPRPKAFLSHCGISDYLQCMFVLQLILRAMAA